MQIKIRRGPDLHNPPPPALYAYADYYKGLYSSKPLVLHMVLTLRAKSVSFMWRARDSKYMYMYLGQNYRASITVG